jgi:hypothetical protein
MSHTAPLGVNFPTFVQSSPNENIHQRGELSHVCPVKIGDSSHLARLAAIPETNIKRRDLGPDIRTYTSGGELSHNHPVNIAGLEAKLRIMRRIRGLPPGFGTGKPGSGTIHATARCCSPHVHRSDPLSPVIIGD